MRRAHADCGEAGTQGFLTALTPGNFLPSGRRQTQGQLLYRNGLVARIALQALGGRTPTWFSRWRWQRLLPRSPDGGVRFNTYRILQSELSEGRAELRAFPITRICQYHSHRNLLLHRLLNLLQSNLWLGLKRNPFRHASLSAALDVLAPHFWQV